MYPWQCISAIISFFIIRRVLFGMDKHAFMWYLNSVYHIIARWFWINWGLLVLVSGVLCQKHVSRTGTNNYIPHYLWDVITCPCPWYLLMAHSFYVAMTRIITGPGNIICRLFGASHLMTQSGNMHVMVTKSGTTFLVCRCRLILGYYE